MFLDRNANFHKETAKLFYPDVLTALYNGKVFPMVDLWGWEKTFRDSKIIFLALPGHEYKFIRGSYEENCNISGIKIPILK